VRLATFRDLQNPAGLPVLAAGLSVADEAALPGGLQAYEEPAWVAGDFPAAVFPGRSAASSFALREAAPLWVEVAASCARVAESQLDSRVPWVQRIELRAAPISGPVEAEPSVRQPEDAAQPVVQVKVVQLSLPVARAALRLAEPWVRQR